MAYNYQSANIYAAAWRAFRICGLTAAIVALALTSLPIISTNLGSRFAENFGPAILGVSFAYVIHATILFNIDSGRKTLSTDYIGNNFTSFMMRSAIFLVFIFVTSAVIAFVDLSVIPEPNVALFIIVMGIVFIVLPLLGVLLSVFGTMLPATVDGTNASFSASKARAKGLFWYTYLRLLAGPVLITIAMVLGVIGLEELGMGIEIFDSMGALSVEGVIVSYGLNLVSLFNTALVATILCKIYLKAEENAALKQA